MGAAGEHLSGCLLEDVPAAVGSAPGGNKKLNKKTVLESWKLKQDSNHFYCVSKEKMRQQSAAASIGASESQPAYEGFI